MTDEIDYVVEDPVANGEMPSFVIAELLGIPIDDGRQLYHLTETLHAASSAVGIEAQQAAFGHMFGYAQQVYAEKREHPAEDLASLLATGELEGRPLDEVDFFLWFLLLVDAGGATTHHLAFGGGGPHSCMGAAIARIEVDALLREVFARLDDLAPAGEEQWLASNFINGPTHLPVTFRPGSRIGA